MNVERWAAISMPDGHDAEWEAARERLALARDLADGDLMLEVLDEAAGLPEGPLDLLRAEAGVGLVRLGREADARGSLRAVVERDPDVRRPDAHTYYALALYRPPDATIKEYDAAERVLKRVLLKRPAHPELRAGLGAIAKRRAARRPREPNARATYGSRWTPTPTTTSTT